MRLSFRIRSRLFSWPFLNVQYVTLCETLRVRTGGIAETDFTCLSVFAASSVSVYLYACYKPTHRTIGGMSAHDEQCAVPKSLTQYRVFIGSPSGLDDERECFRTKLEKFSTLHAEHQNVLFHAVGWEDTLGGVGRPQALINEDLKQCDYAVFVLHNRWGSPTGGGYTSGTAEEWEVAEALYRDTQIRNIALFFKDVDPAQLRDPGPQLQSVLAFKRRIEEGKQYLFKQYRTASQFAETLEEHLARWLRDHKGTTTGLVSAGATSSSTRSRTSAVAPQYDYWITEANRLLDVEVADFTGATFCAVKAIDAASSDIEWARATNVAGVARFRIGQLNESLTSFDTIADRFSTSTDADQRHWQARALVNKGVTLGALDRSAEEIAVYDDLLIRFGSATELPLRELVANALVSKGLRLGALDRGAEEIAVYDDLLARFGSAIELPLRELVANALVSKGFRLGALDRSAEAIAVYDDLLARFGSATELPLREWVAKALVNKGLRLGALDRGAEAIAVFDDLLARFGSATELPLREQVAKALYNKGFRLGALDRSAEEIAVYDDLLARFGSATELPLREWVAKALVNKGVTLGALDRSAEAIAVYDDLLARFGTATELPLRELIAETNELKSSLQHARP